MTEACFCDLFSNFLCSYIPVTCRQFYEYFFSYQIYQVLISEPFDFFFSKQSVVARLAHTRQKIVMSLVCLPVHANMYILLCRHMSWHTYLLSYSVIYYTKKKMCRIKCTSFVYLGPQNFAYSVSIVFTIS